MRKVEVYIYVQKDFEKNKNELEEEVKELPTEPFDEITSWGSWVYYSYITKKCYSSLDELREEEFKYLKEIEEKVKEEKELLRLVNKYNKTKKELRKALEEFGSIDKIDDSYLARELLKNIHDFEGFVKDEESY